MIGRFHAGGPLLCGMLWLLLPTGCSGKINLGDPDAPGAVAIAGAWAAPPGAAGAGAAGADAVNAGAAGLGASAGSGANAGSAAGAGTGPVAGDDGPVTVDDCLGAPVSAGPSFTVRLTERDYNRTLVDLFAPYGRAPDGRDLPEENLVHGFVQARAQDPSAAFIEQYEMGAWDASSLSASQLQQLAPCIGGEQEQCGRAFIERFGKRAFRRPLEAEQVGRYSVFFNGALSQWDYDTAVQMTVAAMLQSPDFLYLLERGEPVDAGGRLLLLDSYAVASRLSYMLTGSMPDAELMAAADADALQTAEQVGAQARRLLATDAARDVVREFHERWLRIDRIWDLQKSAELFPSFDESTEQSLRTSAERFVDWAFWQEGTLQALLTSSQGFVDNNLAGIYGVSAPAGGMRQVDLGSDRAGYFTQAGWLAANANPTEDSPVHRGIFMREQVLCAPTPAPPDTGIPPLPMKGPDLTTRENLELRHQEGTCGACHRLFDGIGFGFGHYDAIGAFRDLDNGKPVDATGGFVEIDGLDAITFDGAPDMLSQLQGTPVVARCLSTQWLRFALRRDTTQADACTVARLTAGLTKEGGDMQELLVSLATSEMFFHKALEE